MRRKDEGGRMKDETRQNRWALMFFLFSSFILHPSSFTHSAPTQDEVLRSIESQIGAQVDSNKLLAFGLIVLAGVGLLIVINHSRRRATHPRPLNSPGKLTREIAAAMDLKSAELRQLRTFAERLQVGHPLVLLLCPSLLARAVHENPQLADQHVLTSLARKTVAKEA